MFAGRVFENPALETSFIQLVSLLFRHLQHDTRIESCRIVCRIDEKYDLSYSIGRMADSSFDTKR